MTKRKKAEFVQRVLMVLQSGVRARSWKQVSAATEVLAKTLAK